MKKNNSFLILLALTLALFSQQVYAQNILEWNFYTASTQSAGTETTFGATLNNSGLETSTLTRGAGAPSKGGCSYAFVGGWVVSADKAAAVANNAYYEFKLQPKDGYYASLSSISFNVRIQTYAAKTYQWTYSIDGGNTFIEIGYPVTPAAGEIDVNNGVMQPSVDLTSISDLQQLNAYKQVMFRLYAWGGTTPLATDVNPTYVNFGLGKSTSSVPSLAISGSVVNYVSDAYIWNFYGSAGTETNYYCTSKNYNLELSNLTRGAGAPATNGNGNGFSANMTVSASLPEAETNQTYFEFSLKPKSGSTASLSGINSNIRTQTYSANTYQWKYSVDGGTFTAIGSPVTVDASEVNVNNGVSQALINLSGISDLQNISSTSTVTFRLYAWGGSTPATDAADKNYVNFGFGKSTSTTPSLTILGTVTGETPEADNVISGWEFSTVGNASSANPSPVSGSFSATTIDTNLSTSIVSRGASLVVGGLYYSYAATSPVSATKQYAIDNNLYFQVNLTPKSNAKVSLSGIKYKFRRLAVGPTNYFWQYSTDGSNYTELYNGVFTSIDTYGDLMTPLDLTTVSALQNVQSPIYFRLYLWGVTNATSVFAIGRYSSGTITTNSLSVYGTTEMNIFTSAKNATEQGFWIDAKNGSVNLNFTHQIAGANVKISDITGRTVLSQKINANENAGRISFPLNLNQGIYIFSISENNSVNSVKFIVP